MWSCKPNIREALSEAASSAGSDLSQLLRNRSALNNSETCSLAAYDNELQYYEEKNLEEEC